VMRSIRGNENNSRSSGVTEWRGMTYDLLVILNSCNSRTPVTPELLVF
jgi:hypothetical protein